MADDHIDPRFEELARTGDQELRNDLVLANQGLAVAFARRYRDRGVPAADLEQVALEALVRAVDRFDPHRGIRFSTFAGRTIEGQLKSHFRDRTWDVQVPRRVRQLAVAVAGARSELTLRLARVPTPAELATELGVGLDDVTLALEAGPGQRRRPLDVADTGPSSREPGFDAVEDRLAATRLLDVLPHDERRVVELRFSEGLSQSAIGARVGVSQMQVSRLLRRALQRLRDVDG